MESGEPKIVNKQELEENLTKTLREVIQFLPNHHAFEEDLPVISKALSEAGFDLRQIEQEYATLLKKNPDTNKLTNESLEKHMMYTLYPVATYEYLEENKKGILLEEHHDSPVNKMQESVHTPLFIRRGLNDNITSLLCMWAQDDEPFLSEKLKAEALRYNKELRKKWNDGKNGNTRSEVPREEKLAEEHKRLTEKLELEKEFFRLLQEKKIDIDVI